MNRLSFITKWDFVLIALILIAAAASFFTIGRRSGGTVLEVSVEGRLYGTYPLSEDRIIEIGDGNVAEISRGEAFMRDASCPGRDCVHSKHIDERGGQIVCLPNRVIMRVGGPPDQVDTVAG